MLRVSDLTEFALKTSLPQYLRAEQQKIEAVAKGYGLDFFPIIFEILTYDSGTGQLLSGSFMDYAMPRADDLPFFDVDSHEVPTKVNPLGAKGVGEAGTVGAMPALLNAVNDALAPLGVRHLDMPVTPERVWRAIREAKRTGRP